ncbi:MAG TPA: hypothetical protein VFN50_00775 [Acidimicrobiales bacterium]|nr:hypothetical protein [Acidimicrobiales bacterium]
MGGRSASAPTPGDDERREQHLSALGDREPPEGTQGEAAGSDAEETGGGEGETRQARAPWHFKVIVVGSVVYLGYRAYQGVSWLAHHIH